VKRFVESLKKDAYDMNKRVSLVHLTRSWWPSRTSLIEKVVPGLKGCIGSMSWPSVPTCRPPGTIPLRLCQSLSGGRSSTNRHACVYPGGH
jgi:hypothetical protein